MHFACWQFARFSHTNTCADLQHTKSELYNGDTQIEITDAKEVPPEAGGNKQTAMQAYINLVRASVGPGMLALPYAFLKVLWFITKNIICHHYFIIAQAGYGLGFGLLAVLSFIILFNMVRLVECRRYLQAKTPFTPVLTYGDMGLAVYGRWGQFLVEVALVVMELGICTVYFEFIATNLGTVIGWTRPTQQRLLMLCLYPILTLLSQIRHMSRLAPFSLLANFLMLVSVGMAISFCVYHLVEEKEVAGDLNVYETAHLPLFLGTVVYSFEGCGALLPVENALKV
jgi:amino acid permease